MSPSRREFVKFASSVVAGTAVWPRRAIAELDPRRPIRDGFEADPAPDVDPNELAAQALDAARSAGASYADIRVDRLQRQGVGIENEVGGNVSYQANVGFGVRVIAKGQWGFVSRTTLTADAVTDAARQAVHQARVNATMRKSEIALAPTAAVSDGRWATTLVVDPFSVPVGEQQELLLAGTTAARAMGSRVTRASASVSFVRLDRTFASSEGSRIAQVFSLADPLAVVEATVAGPRATALTLARGWGDVKAGGYEVVRDGRLPEAMRSAAEEALRRSKQSLTAAGPRSVDVGRYELVVDAHVMHRIVNNTVISALGMRAALGRGADTTYAAPPDRVLGTMQVGAPHLTVRGDRTMAGDLATVGWDDEGVAPEEFALVERGVVVDYLATRETASMLGWWYQRRGAPVRAHGIAVSGRWGDPPGEWTANITIAPGSAAVTVEDMIRDVKHGIYLSGGDARVATDFALMNAYGWGFEAQEIRNGRLVGVLEDVAIQFHTQTFWKGLLAVGGPATVETFADGAFPPLGYSTVRSVPARFREVNVVNTGRTR